MDLFTGYKLNRQGDEYTLILYLSKNQTEFSKELTGDDPDSREKLNNNVVEYVKGKFPSLKINAVKVMVGSMLIASFALGTPQVKAAEISSSTYTVVSGDSLYSIANKYKTTVAELQSLNGLTSTNIYAGQTLKVPTIQTTTTAPTTGTTTYKVAAGDSLSVIAARYNTTVTEIQRLNGLTSTIIYVGQTLKVPAAQTTVTAPTTGTITYKVATGDSLSVIAARYNTTVSEIQRLNGLTSTAIYVGQTLKIPTVQTTMPTTGTTTYAVTAGDSLSAIAVKFNTTVTEIQRLNGLEDTMIYVGQTLKIPSEQTTVPAPTGGTTTYKVVSGDTLWALAARFNTTVDKLVSMNNLTNTILSVGQVLTVPAATTAPTPVPTPTPAPGTTSTAPYVTYKNHTVAAGENSWTISIAYGIPMSELLRVNNFTESTVLNIGQIIRIPVHTVPVTAVPGPQFGEYLDWWTQAQYVFPINKTARVTDFATGRSFNVKRTIGANHSDTEPLTSADAAIIKEVWGGTYSWKTRAVIVEVDGRRIAGSMTSMPHGIEYIGDNSFDGHFDIHFLNSTRHNDGTIDPFHQAQIKIAAGIQ